MVVAAKIVSYAWEDKTFGEALSVMKHKLERLTFDWESSIPLKFSQHMSPLCIFSDIARTRRYRALEDDYAKVMRVAEYIVIYVVTNI